MGIKTIGLSEVLKDLGYIEGKLKSPFENIGNTVGNIAIENIKEKTPVRSGTLRDGNKFDSNNEEIILKNDVEYSGYVNDKNEFFYLDDNVEDEIEKLIMDNIIKEF